MVLLRFSCSECSQNGDVNNHVDLSLKNRQDHSRRERKTQWQKFGGQGDARFWSLKPQKLHRFHFISHFSFLIAALSDKAAIESRQIDSTDDRNQLNNKDTLIMHRLIE